MPYTRLQISPRGDRVALEVREASADVWVWDFERETLIRVTFDAAIEGFPVWSSDETLVFESHRVAQGNIYQKAADGTGTAERLVESPDHQVPLSVSPDGKCLVVEERIGGAGQRDLAILSRETGTAEARLATSFEETGAAISPDGRWMAYQSDESGQPEVYVRPFPNIDEGKWPVSSTGGSLPVWSKDGRELFFLDAEGLLSVVDVGAGDGFTASRPKRILERSFYVSGQGLVYDVSNDGKRFLMIEEDPADPIAPTEIRLILNWFEELERLAPSN